MKVPYWDLQAQYAECKQEIDKGIAGIIQDSEYIGGKIQSDFEYKLSKLATFFQPNLIVKIS